MAYATFEADLDWPSTDVRDFFRWENIAWLISLDGLVRGATLDDGPIVPGATRTLWLAEGHVREQLVAIVDAEAFSFTYRVIDPGPLAVEDYVGCIRVIPTGPGRCTISFRCDYHPAGIDPDAWAEIYRASERMLVERINALLSARG